MPLLTETLLTMKIKWLFVLFITAFLIPCHSCFGQLSAGESMAISDFGKTLDDDLREDNLHSSISTVIIKNGKVVRAAAFGYAGMNRDIAADTSTIYRIGSITKTFTVVILLQLVEEGKIKLDDAIESFVPEIRSLRGYSDKTKITLRQLASHTSGLKREPEMPGSSIGPVEQWENKVLSCIPYTSFNSRPGEDFLYSNIGFALLGLALERASGTPYIQMVQQRIFTPLHMDDSFFIPPEEKKSRLAEGIENSNKGTINTSLPLKEIEGRGYRVPNGGIYSTPLDLAKFVISMTGKSALLKAESLAQMQHVPPGGRNYGLGLAIMHGGGLDIIGHDGSVPGYTAEFAIEQRKGYAVILMRNYNVGKTNLEGAARKLLKSL